MGRVRTKTVKKTSRQVIEKYYSRMTLDFHTNKKVLEEVSILPSKRLRNKVAGFTTHLMRRIQRGPVRGISLKLLRAPHGLRPGEVGARGGGDPRRRGDHGDARGPQHV